MSTYITTVQFTEEQRRYIEGRVVERSQETGLNVRMADVVREAVDLLREQKPLRTEEPAQVG